MDKDKEPPWRQNILKQLQNRHRKETESFQDLISEHNKIFENINTLRHENLQLSIQNEKLKEDGIGGVKAGSSLESRLQIKVQELNQKLLHQADELTELHKRKGENVQQIVNLNVILQEKDKLLALKNDKIVDLEKKLDNSQKEVLTLALKKAQLTKLFQDIKDEYQASQLECTKLEEKLKLAQSDRNRLHDDLFKLQFENEEKKNEEKLNIQKQKALRIQKELEDACRDSTKAVMEELSENFPLVTQSLLPSKVLVKFDAHDGEINAVKWSPIERVVATGGADRKVKMWDISKGVQENKGIFVGSNAGITDVDIDISGSLILAASTDYAARVWTISNQRLRHSLTGHSGKVLASKFMGDTSKVVTGSHDRTLKIWDIRSKACIATKFAGSSCNDLVTIDSVGSTIISGHYDKSIRFWDSRSESCSANNILLNGKVTSLDLSRDANYLLACVRDDTLKLIDLRMHQEVNSFSGDGFKVTYDFSRATFSPHGQYVAVGSADGSVYIWGVKTGKVETILKEHNSAVTAAAWHPYGTFLATVDRSKKIVIWSGDII